MTRQIAAYRALHQSGCFVLPNAWDAGSAVWLEHLGFKAIATTSAGFAWTQALSDAKVPRDLMVRHVAEISAATSLPVNADFQGGYADAPQAVAGSVALCAKTGCAGLSIEDSHEGGLYERALAIERVKAARAAAGDVVLTARCEAFLAGAPDAARTVLDRLPEFAAAGADCLYAPGVKDLKLVAEIVKAVAPKPVNVLVSGPWTTVAQLRDLGVRRISVGGALARAAWGGFTHAARELAEQGTFESFISAMSFDDLEKLFGQR